jgi:transposase
VLIVLPFAAGANRRGSPSVGLAALAQPHRPPRLPTNQLRQLEIILACGAVANDWLNQLWMTARVGEVVFQYFGIRDHHHVGRLLHHRLGCTTQKSRRGARDRGEHAILRWQSETLPPLARQAQERGAHLVFLDESGFMLPRACVRRGHRAAMQGATTRPSMQSSRAMIQLLLISSSSKPKRRLV